MSIFCCKVTLTRPLGPAIACGTAATAWSRDLATAASVLKTRAEMKPQYGGILKYVVPAEPPSFDGHRETTFALIHPIAPFYSLLMRVNPDNPGDPTDFVCALCVEVPKPTNGGKTYNWKIKEGVQLHDGTPLTATACKASRPEERRGRKE